MKGVDVDFRVVEHGDGDDAHACQGCGLSVEPIVMVNPACSGSLEVFICAQCMKGALGLLRGLGLTS